MIIVSKSDGLRLPWKETARVESSNMRMLAAALPLADRLTETVKILRSYHMAFSIGPNGITYEDGARSGLTELELLRLMALSRNGVSSGFLIKTDMQMFVDYVSTYPNFHYTQSGPLTLADQLAELNSSMKTYSAALLSEILGNVGSGLQRVVSDSFSGIGPRSIPKKHRMLFERAVQMKTAAGTVAELCDLIPANIAEILQELFERRMKDVRRYVELKEKLARNGLDEAKKQALRSELVRLTFPRSLEMMDVQSQPSSVIILGYTPFFTQTEASPAPTIPSRSAEEDETMARDLFPGLAAKVDAEIAAERAEAKLRETAERELSKAKQRSFKLLVRDGVPIEFIRQCFASGIISAGAIIDKFLEIDTFKPEVVRIKSYVRRAAEAVTPKSLTDELVTRLFDTMLHDRFGSPPALTAPQNSILFRVRDQIETFVREFAEYSLKQEGERGVFAPNGKAGLFKEKWDTHQSAMENWRVFGLQLGNSRVVIATDARTADMKLIGVYNKHDDYVSDLAVFQGSTIQSAVRIFRSANGSPDFSIIRIN